MDKERIRVILRNIQIHDNLEPAWEDEGEFRFTARVIADTNVPEQEMTLPSDDSYYKVSDHPARNRIYLNKVLFEGEVKGRLQVEIRGEEIDRVSSNNELEPYIRTWEGDPSTWIGLWHPGDEGKYDPEKLGAWGVEVEIEKA